MSDSHLDQMVKEYKEKQAKLIAARWAIGFKDRGMGHGDYGVVTGSNDLIVECPSKEIAEHIVALHNKDISDGKYSSKKAKTKAKAGRREPAPANGKPRKRRATGG